MSNRRLSICPKCGQRGVEGYSLDDANDKKARALLVGGIGLAAAALTGGVATAILAGMAANKGVDFLKKSGGELKFTFRCPLCGHEFTEWLKA